MSPLPRAVGARYLRHGTSFRAHPAATAVGAPACRAARLGMSRWLPATPHGEYRGEVAGTFCGTCDGEPCTAECLAALRARAVSGWPVFGGCATVRRLPLPASPR